MKQNLQYSLLLTVSILLTVSATAQLNLDAKSIFTIKNGWMQLGANYEVQLGSNSDYSIYFGASGRLPISDKDKSLVEIDRNSDAWKGILSGALKYDYTDPDGDFTREYHVKFNYEYGKKGYSYYENADLANKVTNELSSNTCELLFMSYYGNASSGAQHAWHFKSRYGVEPKEQDKVILIPEWQPNMVNTASEVRIETPHLKPKLNLGLARMNYSGTGPIVNCPSYNLFLTGADGFSDPFSDKVSMRFEYWIFYFPTITGAPNTRVGVAPFLNYNSSANSGQQFTPGVLLQLKTAANMLEFF